MAALYYNPDRLVGRQLLGSPAARIDRPNSDAAPKTLVIGRARLAPAMISTTPVRRALVEIGGFRSLLCAALRKDDCLLGMFHIYR
jgi:hypothetical protein